MEQRKKILATILTYSGTLPFVACAASVYWPVAGVNTPYAAATYSVTILSFLCGIHWAVYLFFSEKCPRHLLITSNAIAVLAWGVLLLAHSPLATLIYAVCFTYLLALDHALYDAGLIPEWFYRLRRNATVIVVACLVVLVGIV